MIGARSLRTPTGMPSTPMAEVLFRPMITRWTCCSVGARNLKGASPRGIGLLLLLFLGLLLASIPRRILEILDR